MSREELVYVASVAQETERYDDIVSGPLGEFPFAIPAILPDRGPVTK